MFLFHQRSLLELGSIQHYPFVSCTHSRPHIKLRSCHDDVLKNPASNPFPKWPTSVVISDGNYEGEAYLEELIGGTLEKQHNDTYDDGQFDINPPLHLYSCQKDLPLLPVPTISQTIKTFFLSALPLVETKEEEENLISACASFPSEAKKAQERLEARKQEKNESSWLQQWWNSVGYLQMRDSVVINHSYFFPMKDDGTLYTTGSNRLPYIKRAACTLTAIAEYRKLICSGQMPVERIGKRKTPLCSTSFKYMFHTCRIARKGQDEYRLYDPHEYKHCILAYSGQFFSFDFVDDYQKALPREILEQSLERCVDKAKQQRTKTPQLGFLTGVNRDDCAEYREQLMKISGMKEALERLESGAVLICLDDFSPSTWNECVPLFWYGGNSGHYMNRWFDKPMQFVIEENGRMSFMGEHSMIDGHPTVGLMNHVENMTYKDIVNKDSDHDTSSSQTTPVVEHVFEGVLESVISNEDVMSSIDRAKQEFISLTKAQNMTIDFFPHYGSEYIKRLDFSPDAFVQMAFQLASYRLFGTQVATYESSQVRGFLHGRTEAIRTVSFRSNEFVKCMGLSAAQNEDNPVIREKKISTLRAAAYVHSKYSHLASKGLGCDRHLFGLALASDSDNKRPTLLDDPVFLRSQHWRLSTSTLPYTPGFGCVVDDGIGIGYTVKSHSMYFAVSSRAKNKIWVRDFIRNTEEALTEMRKLLDADRSK